MSLVAVLIFNNFTHEICGDINKYGISILYNEKCHNVEDLNKSVIPYFLDDQCMMFQNHEG